METKEFKYKVGDIIKVTSPDNDIKSHLGKIYRIIIITDNLEDNMPYGVGGWDDLWFAEDEIELVPDEEAMLWLLSN